MRSESAYRHHIAIRDYHAAQAIASEPVKPIVDKNGSFWDSEAPGYDPDVFDENPPPCNVCGGEMKTHFLGIYTNRIVCPEDK